MAVEINGASEVLQIKHQSTNKWSPGVTLLRLEEGFDVRLVESQIQKIDAITTQVAKLATLTSTQEIQETLVIVSQSLADILTQETTQTTNVLSFYQSIASAIAQLTQISQSVGTANQAISTQLTSLAATISSLNATIVQLGQNQNSSQTTVTIQGETEVYETVVDIVTANQVKPCSLPNSTKSLVFVGRKDTLGRSYDLRWSFKDGSIEAGNYKTLWAYCEYQKSNLNFKDKTLYLSCGTPIQVDVTAYYLPS